MTIKTEVVKAAYEHRISVPSDRDNADKTEFRITVRHRAGATLEEVARCAMGDIQSSIGETKKARPVYIKGQPLYIGVSITDIEERFELIRLKNEMTGEVKFVDKDGVFVDVLIVDFSKDEEAGLGPVSERLEILRNQLDHIWLRTETGNDQGEG